MAASLWTQVLRVEPRHMMIVLLLLCACVSTGLSFEESIKKVYGTKFSMRLSRRAQSLEFRPSHNSAVTILWKRDDPQPIEDSRHKLVDNYYEIRNVTQDDNGRYIVRDRYQQATTTKIVEIDAYTDHQSTMSGHSLRFQYDMEPSSCNIYFYPEEGYETVIVRHGRLQDSKYSSDCVGFKVVAPCGVLNENAEMSCYGRFEIRDNNGNKAYVLYQDMEFSDPPEEEHYDPSYLGIGAAAIFSSLLGCCLKRCCCGKSSSKKSSSESAADAADADAAPAAAAAAAAAAEPAVYYHEYDQEPFGRRTDQLSEPSGTHHPTQASCASTGPLIHNPSTFGLPPPYSEVCLPAEQADTPTLPPYSEVEPRFELKGMSYNSALGSESTSSDVYTSDKLNFL